MWQSLQSSEAGDGEKLANPGHSEFVSKLWFMGSMVFELHWAINCQWTSCYASLSPSKSVGKDAEQDRVVYLEQLLGDSDDEAVKLPRNRMLNRHRKHLMLQ